jgi:hypothetical protein
MHGADLFTNSNMSDEMVVNVPLLQAGWSQRMVECTRGSSIETTCMAVVRIAPLGRFIGKTDAAASAMQHDCLV